MFLSLYSINWLNFIVWLPLLCKILGQYGFCNCLKTRLWCLEFFELNLIFLIKPFFLHDQKAKQITQLFLEGESPTLSTKVSLFPVKLKQLVPQLLKTFLFICFWSNVGPRGFIVVVDIIFFSQICRSKYYFLNSQNCKSVSDYSIGVSICIESQR